VGFEAYAVYVRPGPALDRLDHVGGCGRLGSGALDTVVVVDQFNVSSQRLNGGIGILLSKRHICLVNICQEYCKRSLSVFLGGASLRALWKRT
jgi:hypothetical protein